MSHNLRFFRYKNVLISRKSVIIDKTCKEQRRLGEGAVGVKAAFGSLLTMRQQQKGCRSSIVSEELAVCKDEKALRRARRRAIRHECKVRIEALVRCTDAITKHVSTNALEYKGRLLDLTPKAITLFMREPLDEDQKLRILIGLPGERPLATQAVVKWAKPMPDKDAFAVCARFKKLPPEELNTILRYLHALGKRLEQEVA